MRQVELSRGLVALVDDADYEQVTTFGKWYADPSKKTFYARKNFEVEPGRWISVRMHTLLTGWDQVDHINGDGLDNRRANLRKASTVENSQNRGLRTDNRSGYKGVSWNKQCRKWVGKIQVNGRAVHLGLFADPETAAAAYDAAALEHFGSFARVNVKGK